MRKLLLIISILGWAIGTAQVSDDNFEKVFPDVKSLEVENEDLEMGYEDHYDDRFKHIAYKVNGIYLEYENEKWFIPYRRIRSIDLKQDEGVIICLKS